jgi:hypothetical protein
MLTMMIRKRLIPVCPICGLEDPEPCSCNHPRTTMANLAMARKLASGETLDVRKEGFPLSSPLGVYVLNRFVDGKDYCDAEAELWIFSIGRFKYEPMGKELIYASTDARFYQHPLYECLFLR